MNTHIYIYIYISVEKIKRNARSNVSYKHLPVVSQQFTHVTFQVSRCKRDAIPSLNQRNLLSREISISDVDLPRERQDPVVRAVGVISNSCWNANVIARCTYKAAEGKSRSPYDEAGPPWRILSDYVEIREPSFTRMQGPTKEGGPSNTHTHTRKVESVEA